LGEHRLFYLVLVLVAVGIISAQIGAYYYLEKSSSPNGSTLGTVNTLINYGNGTMKWYNETKIPANWNFYNLTVYLTRENIVAPFDTLLNEHYVTGINGVNNHSPYFWTLWTFCEKQSAWAQATVGADKIFLGNNSTLAWAYQIPYQSPVPEARTVGLCS
jgi:hypothetical protein